MRGGTELRERARGLLGRVVSRGARGVSGGGTHWPVIVELVGQGGEVKLGRLVLCEGSLCLLCLLCAAQWHG